MNNLIFVLSGESDKFCNTSNGVGAVFGIIGWVLLIIKIAVPIILLIMGMIDMASAIMSHDDKNLTKALNQLLRRGVAAACVFLITTGVILIFGVFVNSSEYKSCKECINHPATCKLNLNF